MGYIPFNVLAYIPWTLVPFNMIPIGPGSSSSEDRPTVIKITMLTHLLTWLPPLYPHPLCQGHSCSLANSQATLLFGCPTLGDQHRL